MTLSEWAGIRSCQGTVDGFVCLVWQIRSAKQQTSFAVWAVGVRGVVRLRYFYRLYSPDDCSGRVDWFVVIGAPHMFLKIFLPPTHFGCWVPSKIWYTLFSPALRRTCCHKLRTHSGTSQKYLCAHGAQVVRGYRMIHGWGEFERFDS